VLFFSEKQQRHWSYLSHVMEFNRIASCIPPTHLDHRVKNYPKLHVHHYSLLRVTLTTL